MVLLWGVRIIACGLFVMQLLAAFDEALPEEVSCDVAGKGGYASFVKDKGCVTLALALAPKMILSAISIMIGMILIRYGLNLTLRVHRSRGFRSIIICSLAYAVSQIFSERVYPVTSSAGDIILLLGVTYLVFLVQEDFTLAGTYADFLRSSNVAFKEYDMTHSSRCHKTVEKKEENEENIKNEINELNVKPEKNGKNIFHFNEGRISEKSEGSALTVDRGRLGVYDVLENKEINSLDRIDIDISDRINIDISD
eukprot:CAMPEP_0119047864 /NCGR_PEP_ID=MMETSP1177-20130426/55450_1 /TAXON_ID=2985 /ORGANISM="Ochromonas sp, Strain CCMP1899" /LENGTH=253 /DNA_ID=CAMNT_0007022977 /DNA_START=427 /DNA_END=1185 /DNA_ORIENTATION=+